jgi:hypothetical protein
MHPRLRSLPPTFTTAEARAARISSRDLYALRDKGIIQELSRGVFRTADAPASAHLDMIAVAARSPISVVCLESALALHELIDDIPTQLHIAVPRGSRPPAIDYPPVTVSRFDPETFPVGIERFEAGPGEYVRVYSAVRSVVDAMRLRHRVGESLALHALGRFLRANGSAGVPQLLELARLLGVEGPIRSTVEAVFA